ncbi:MAG: ferritin-like domain-containing protein [wastewater metagenome]|nr:ferritin-like domain-containing protein [Candidatus Loosdrechtia aerotolerans]
MKEIAKNLSLLIQLDVDAVYSYDQVIKEVDDPVIRDQLNMYRRDHMRHIDELSRIMASLGETPIKRMPDFKGFLTPGFMTLLNLTGTEGALRGLESNEKVASKIYHDARSWYMPPEIKDLIEKHSNDEYEHVRYIQERLGVISTPIR